MENPQQKVILVTGANSGMGKETALSLAKMGASLVLVCRNEDKGRAAMNEIIQKSGNSSVELLIADLQSQKEVRRVANEFLSNHPRLDVLVNNAGTNFPTYAETEDGIERTMAVNYFAPFLLTNLLLALLGSSAPSRVVNVTSEEHFGAKLDLSNLSQDRMMGTVGSRAYGRSKLALVLFTYELARRLERNKVTANCVDPGAVRTKIWGQAGALTPIMRLLSLFMKGPAEGAKTSIYLASSPDVECITGKYFENCKEKRSSDESYDQSLSLKLWNKSLELTHLTKSATMLG